MNDFDKSMFDGKTILSTTYKFETGCDETLTIQFTDGSNVTVGAMSCNDDTGALTFHHLR